MPPRRKTTVTIVSAEGPGASGAGIFGDIGRFLKKNKVISRVGSALGAAGVPYASTVGKVAGSVGYGRARGGALRVAGQGKKKRAAPRR